MDTEKCQALLTVLEQGNLTSAANKLGYTTSGISRMMASLEEETNLKLLHRGKHGVTPTAACERMLPLIRDLARLGNTLHNTAAAINGLLVGHIQIGTAYGRYYGIMAQLIADFSKEFPNIKIGIIEGNSSQLAMAVSKHEADFCIISERDGHFDWEPLFDDEMRVWLPSNHPMVDVPRYALGNLAKDPFIEFYPNEVSDNLLIFQRYHIHPNTKYTVRGMVAAYEMVRAGLGVTLVNALYDFPSKGGVVAKPTSPHITIPIGIAISHREEISPAAAAFRDFAVPKFQEMIRET